MRMCLEEECYKLGGLCWREDGVLKRNLEHICKILKSLKLSRQPFLLTCKTTLKLSYLVEMGFVVTIYPL